MNLITLILELGLVGFILWLVTTYIPMPDVFKKTITVVIVVALILWVLNILGVGNVAIPTLHK